jgi:catechol 2,3-dioxygenase-like lactoylglutathione lyase family enzyme
VALAHITLATRDVSHSVEFFGDLFGWRPTARPGNITASAAWLEIEPGIELHLIEDVEFEPSRFEKEFGRHIAITADISDFPRLRERVQSGGGTLIDPIRATPFLRFFFRDPNGYVFEVVEQEHDEPRPIE